MLNPSHIWPSSHWQWAEGQILYGARLYFWIWSPLIITFFWNPTSIITTTTIIILKVFPENESFLLPLLLCFLRLHPCLCPQKQEYNCHLCCLVLVFISGMTWPARSVWTSSPTSTTSSPATPLRTRLLHSQKWAQRMKIQPREWYLWWLSGDLPRSWQPARCKPGGPVQCSHGGPGHHHLDHLTHRFLHHHHRSWSPVSSSSSHHR